MREDLDHVKVRWDLKYNDHELSFAVFCEKNHHPDIRVAEIAYNSLGEGHITFEAVDGLSQGLVFDVRMRGECCGKLMEKWIRNITVTEKPRIDNLLEITCSPDHETWKAV